MQPYGPPPEAVPAIPAGWYPLSGQLRYWDGYQWTEHRQSLAPAGVPAYQRNPVQPYTSVVTDSRTNGVEVAIAWVFTVLSIGYMLPWAIGATRGKSNSLAIGLVNLLLGWTVVGWLAALVMSCTAHQVAVVRL